MRGRRLSRALRRRPLNSELEAHAGRVIRDIRSRGPILLDMENHQVIAQSVLLQLTTCITRVPFVSCVCAMAVFVCVSACSCVVCLRTHARHA